MSVPKFTPGPWEWHWRNGDDVNPGSVCSIGGRNTSGRPYAVAMCPRYRGPNNPNDRWDADAHLIAAAPDLYDMLASIENDDGCIPAWLWDRIQQTLAKARGETP